MLIIRAVDPNEADALSRIAFAAKSHWGYPERWLEIWKPQLTFDPGYFQSGENWVAAMDEVPVAFYTLWVKLEFAWLENLWVLPEHVGKGIGRWLFLHAMNLSRDLGYKILRLEADPNAAGFYERMGMRKVGERHSEVAGQPRILPVMEIDL
jgi:GNAT superfamily N-acetyltransferase